MVHVINRFQRPAKKTVDRFRGIGTATVHEASGRKGYVDCAIKPIARGVRICGPAFTVQCHPRDNLMLHKALERAQPGDVIVASVGGYYEAGYWGGLINHPTLFGGAIVNPGDIILGDDDGMVIVARTECEDVLAKSLARVDLEEKKAVQLASGISSVEFNKLGKIFDFLGLREE